MISLATGAAAASASLADYKYKGGYIQALTDVLEKCREIELEMYGKRPTAEAAE